MLGAERPQGALYVRKQRRLHVHATGAEDRNVGSPTASLPLHTTTSCLPQTRSTDSMQSTEGAKAESAEPWQPPTPRSNLVPLPTPTLPVDHLVLLPPPILPTPGSDAGQHSLPSIHDGGAQGGSRAQMGWSPEQSLAPQQKKEDDDHDWFPSADTAAAASKRPRRSAAMAAARKIPRQPSPFDLEDEDSDAEEADPSPSVSPPPTTSSRTTGGNGTAKRKVSHSLIERRRREKINECLANLRETVPNLREEGERKIARAKERGRKRGRGDDAGERGGLHKLEILQVRCGRTDVASTRADSALYPTAQGTIAYIEDLRARVEALERTLPPAPSPSLQAEPHVPKKLILKRPVRTEDAPGLGLSPRTVAESLPGTHKLPPTPRMSTSTSIGSSSGSGDVDDHEASLLLLSFSTSPELRPVL